MLINESGYKTVGKALSLGFPSLVFEEDCITVSGKESTVMLILL